MVVYGLISEQKVLMPLIKDFCIRVGGPAGRVRPGPAGHSKNGSEKHEIVKEMGWHGGLWADF